MSILSAGAIATLTTLVFTPALTQTPVSGSVTPVVASTSSLKTADEAAISSIIQSVAALADRGDFETLESLFADEVQVDYTSLFGGEVETYIPESLMTIWASVLPGFDQTYHAISNIRIDVDEDEATATADGIANHYLNEDYWQVTGQYRYRLMRQTDGWQITQITFELIDEKGDRTLLELARTRARTTPVAYLQRQQTEQVVRDFLTSLEVKDMDAFAAVWAEDAVQDMPYAPEGFPRRVEGRDNLIEHYSDWPTVSGAANFTDELVFYPMQNPSMVFAEWRGVVEIIPTGRVYEQRYGGLFHVVNGEIMLFREYFDPIVFTYAFGLDEGSKFGNN